MPNPESPRRPTHRQLSAGLCPSLVMKQTLTMGLDDAVFDAGAEPGDGYYWCVRTCREIGPDDEVVRPRACVPGRRCYEGVEQ